MTNQEFIKSIIDDKKKLAFLLALMVDLNDYAITAEPFWLPWLDKECTFNIDDYYKFFNSKET